MVQLTAVLFTIASPINDAPALSLLLHCGLFPMDFYLRLAGANN
jgi:hypothetical protein